mmetsp:Transcript_37722/g.120231  ORF Transcript_37722/g.120231 Transcript_37722/m.120231 type:complete len:202 (+) Transcript_37722:232-837(+)
MYRQNLCVPAELALLDICFVATGEVDANLQLAIELLHPCADLLGVDKGSLWSGDEPDQDEAPVLQIRIVGMVDVMLDDLDHGVQTGTGSDHQQFIPAAMRGITLHIFDWRFFDGNTRSDHQPGDPLGHLPSGINLDDEDQVQLAALNVGVDRRVVALNSICRVDEPHGMPGEQWCVRVEGQFQVVMLIVALNGLLQRHDVL